VHVGLTVIVVALASAAAGASAGTALPTPPPGWKLEVVAAAPVVKHPSVVCCAPDGRVFVAEDPMDIRTQKADAPAGRVICLHPGGRITTFADNLHAVFGMQYLEDKLFVLHNPKFTVYADGGDAGKDPRDLVECTNPNPWALDWNDHVPANFKLAIDGYFYLAVGDKGLYGATGTDGRRVDLRGGGVVRIRPDGSGLEVFCTGVRNILDVALNDEDEVFTYDNTDEHDWMGRLTHMVDGGFYGYPYDFVPRRPYTLWMMADYGAGAATGTLCYTDDVLPPEYRGNLFLADFGKRNVLRVRVERDGATFKAVSRQDLFTDVPADFRPVGIAFGPDGASMYVCDWQHVDTKEDVEVGRLLKLSYAGKTAGRPKPDWFVAESSGRPFGATDEQLVAALSHPSHPVRLVAQRRLANRGGAVVDRLKTLIGTVNTWGYARVHAIWALDAVDGGAAAREQIIRATSDNAPTVRRQALRQLATRRVAEALPAALARLTDYDPTVRFHAAAACGRIGGPSAVPALLETVGDGDAWTAHAARNALNQIGRAHPDAWTAIAQGLRHDAEAIREGAAMALRDTYSSELVDAVATVAGDREASPAARAAAVRVLGPLHHRPPEWKGQWWAYHPALGPPPPKTEAWDRTPTVLAVLRAALDRTDNLVRLAAVAGLEQAADAEAAGALRWLFENGQDGSVRLAALAALRTCDDGHSGPFFKAHLFRADRDRTLDADVMRTLGKLKTDAAIPLMTEYARLPNQALRSAAFEALVSTGGELAAKAVIDLLRDPSLDVRLGAVRAAGELGDRSAIRPLLTAYVARDTRTAALDALARMPDAQAAGVYLEGLSSGDFAVREKCKSALREVRDAALPAVESALAKPPSDDAVLELQQIYADHATAKQGPLFRIKVNRKHPSEYMDYALGHSGDARSGERLFAVSQAGGTGCATCHMVNGRGGTVGPDLSEIGAKYSRRDLAESVLYPNKAVREGYQQVIVRTKAGQSYAGPVKAQAPGLLVLQEADGTLRRIPTAEIEARKETALSPMPEGLHTGLSPEQFTDLVSYLESLKSPSPGT
jgi:putative membrane-bound dehydrogenase-like protein